MVFLLAFPAAKLGCALGHLVVSQAVVPQVVLFHNIKPSLAISHCITCVGWMVFCFTKHTGLLPIAELPFFLGSLSAEATWNAEVVDLGILFCWLYNPDAKIRIPFRIAAIRSGRVEVFSCKVSLDAYRKLFHDNQEVTKCMF